MQLKTTDSKFLKYGNSFRNTELLEQKLKKELHVYEKDSPILYYANDDVFVKESIGIITITIGETSDIKNMKTFILSKTIRIKKGCWFYFATLTTSSNIYLYYDNELDLYKQGEIKQMDLKRKDDTFEITKLYFCSYSMKTAGYHFHSEQHSCWELTFVDEGKLNTNIDGVSYTLESNQYMFYVPNQRHSQDISNDSNCSYLMIAFETSLLKYQFLKNTVFTCNDELMNLFYIFIHSDDHQKFMPDYLKLKLKELIILTYNLEYESEIHEDSYYYNKLLNSKVLLKQNKYTMEEVADFVGFRTANYFSRMFKNRYGVSPTKYCHLKK